MPSLAKSKQSVWTRYRCPIVSVGVILVAVLILYSRCPPSPTPVVKIQEGQLQGIVVYSRNGTEYWSFRGIPYAHPPLGKLRFEPPIPSRPWKGILHATQFAPICFQFDAMIYHTFEGAEDCLYLNVFSPPTKFNNESRPVIVYLPGGGFMSGGANYHHPDYIMDHKLVLVTLSYRLGPFGFLNLESKSGNGSLPRGNMGLKDQLLALKWVQKNIKYFGGNPNLVTIAGQSAGAVSVHAHVLSSQSKGLFHKAIALSGATLCPWGFSKEAKQVSRKLMEKIKCRMDDQEKLLKCLEDCDAKELVKHQLSMVDPRLEKDLLLPSVEVLKTDDTFFDRHPLEIIKSGNFSKVPFIMGVNGGEGAFRVARFDAIPDLVPEYQTNFSQLLGKYMGFDYFPSQLSDQIRLHFFGNFSFTEDPATFKQIFAQVGSQAAIYEPVQRSAILHARSGSPTFLYFYNYRPYCVPGMYSLYRAVPLDDWLPAKVRVNLVIGMDWINEFLLGEGGSRKYGISHGDDIFQVWNLDGQSSSLSFGDTDFSESFVKVFVNFASDYNNSSNDTHFSYRNVPWPPINTTAVDEMGEKMEYMLIDNSERPKMIPEPFTEGIEYWRSLGIQNFN